MMEGHSFDELAKDLSASEISRRRMLGLLGGAFLGTTLGAFGFQADASARRRRRAQRRKKRRRKKRGAQTALSSADAALDRALQELVGMPGGPPGVISIVQRGESLGVHQFGLADLSSGQSPHITDHMRIASVAKAFSGATALSLVSKGKL